MGARVRTDRDYYRTLGIAPGAGVDEIRRAYRRLAMEWHPDRHAGDRRAEERFKEISEAYAVLGDTVRRREYDRAREAGAAWEPAGRREDLFRDLLRDPFAAGLFEELARRLERQGFAVDRHYFRQTLLGGRVVVTGGVFVVGPWTPVLALLQAAHAALRGARPGTEAAALPSPRGVLRGLGRAARWLLGPPAPGGPPAPAGGDLDVTATLVLTTGEALQGIRQRVCLPDGGELLVSVPAGTLPGTRLRLRGRGRPGAGGQRGDAYLVVEVSGEPASGGVGA